MRLENKVVLITGAGAGIGRAMALLFAREGARLAVVDRDGPAAAETARRVTEDGGTAVPLVCDVTVGPQVEQTLAACVEHYGRIDVLCNNAGVGSNHNVLETTEEVWDLCFDVNVKGVFWGCKYAIPYMVAQGGGVIVNTASVAGLVGIPNRVAYCASKGAVITLTKAIAVDHVAQNIRVNCVCPGTVDGPWTERNLARSADPVAERAMLEARQPMGRLGQPEEVALAALYLAGDESRFCTGTALIIDGGIAAR
ncbi:MAG TPA: SDR family oxidoreductase [Chloroflexota bacterium]|nr:SDR family oxidoreductase [Chloroflexota bacterium]